MIPLFLVSFFVFRSCVSSPTPPQTTKSINQHTVFVVLAPINKEQLNLAISFVLEAESNLMVQDTNYEIKGICNENLQYLDSLEYSKFGSTRFDQLLKWLGETKNQTCDSSSSSAKESLKSVINRINDYLNQNQSKNLIVFIQLPWKKVFSQKDYTELNREVDKIKDKTRVKKIYIFGLNDDSISKMFSGFNDSSNTPQRVFISGINSREVKKKILEAREFMRSAK